MIAVAPLSNRLARRTLRFLFIATAAKMIGLAGLATMALAAEQPPAITYLVNPLRGITGFAGDSRGNVYVTGATNTVFAPTPGSPYPILTGGAALVKLDPQGETVFATYLPGAPVISGTAALALDEAGNIWVLTRRGYDELLLVAVDPSGRSARVYQILSCRLCADLKIGGVAIDTEGNVYIAGTTGSDLPTTAKAFQPNRAGFTDEYILKYNPKSETVLYATFLSGVGDDSIDECAIDAEGNAYVGGRTTSKDFPITPSAYQTELQGTASGFLTKIRPDGAGLAFSTYLDGIVYKIALEPGGGVFAGVYDHGLLKLSPDGRRVLTSIKLDLWFQGFDPAGNIVAFGSAPSTSGTFVYPLQLLGTRGYPFQFSNCLDSVRGCSRAILGKLDSHGKVIWSSVLGRNDQFRTSIAGVSVDSAGNIYAAIENFGFIKVEPVGPPPLLAEASIVSSAGFKTGIAYGGLVTIFGSGLTSVQGAISASLPLPVTLEGTSVSMNGQPARMLAVANVNGQEQLNVQAAWPRDPRFSHESLRLIVRRGRAMGYADVTGFAQYPQMFTVGEQPAITHADGSLLTSSNPARPGETIVVWYTGGGDVTPAVITGDPAPLSPLSRTIVAPLVSISGQDAIVAFSGLTPGFVGLYQLNVIVPPAPSGPAALSLAVPNFFNGGVPLVTSTAMIPMQ